MKSLIQEGLARGDLEDLVLPLLSIDQYQSKIDDATNIVVGFYCFEEDVAHDLSNFIERSPYLVQDTDVSPAPTKDGYYITFIEMNRTPEFVSVLLELLAEVTRLTNVKNWQFQCPKLEKDDIKPLDQKTLERYVDTDVRDPKKEKIREVFEFFRHSTLTDVLVDRSILVLEKRGVELGFEILSLSHEVPVGRFYLDETSVSRCLVLERFLCGPYSINCLDGDLVIQSQDQFLTLRPL